ncbi:MAG: hypothetical protein EDR02_01860 [Actinobacteria bacterium]|nr:MAG: hypothetical protein EDR02_01860 [Actinomycetota bacterium]
MPTASGNGRFVAFRSEASNLVADDTNEVTDVFVRDNVAGTTVRISVDSAGQEANAASDLPAISDDGRFVTFRSTASNLVEGDTNGRADVFLRDTQLGLTTRVSVDSAGNQGDSSSDYSAISADGRFVAFDSAASSLVPGDTNDVHDIFLRDTLLGLTTRVSVDSAGNQASWHSENKVSISGDGRYVAFTSWAADLVPGDTNNASDVFVRDTQLGLTTRVSVDSTGNQGLTDSNGAAISTDGQYVAFMSAAPNLVAADTNDTNDVFVHDRTTGLTTRASVDSTGVQGNDGSVWPNISGTGRYVTFVSYATNLVADDTNGLGDVFVHDTSSGKTTRVNVDAAHNQANGITGWPVISRDGVYVVFYSHATNLVPADSNGAGDFFRVTRW